MQLWFDTFALFGCPVLNVLQGTWTIPRQLSVAEQKAYNDSLQQTESSSSEVCMGVSLSFQLVGTVSRIIFFFLVR